MLPKINDKLQNKKIIPKVFTNYPSIIFAPIMAHPKAQLITHVSHYVSLTF